MDSYELSERLSEACMPIGRIRDWARVTVAADDDLKMELLIALEGSEQFRKQLIAAAACEGPDKGTILGIGGSLNQEAVRYIRFVIALADTAISTKITQHGDAMRVEKVVPALQKAFEWTKAVFPDPLSEAALHFSKAALVSLAANGNPFLEVVQDEITYLAGHYEALEPYLTFIIQTRDMSYSQLNMLLATKPVVPLVGGQL